METLRITLVSANGLPYISLGAVVDDHYDKKEITTQHGQYTFTQSLHYFRDPGSFKPHRWLPHDDEHRDGALAIDTRELFLPFRFVETTHFQKSKER